MYKIIGIDQKIYGPVSADQLRRWLAEGRLNHTTLILAEGGADWKPLLSFPEFAIPPLVPPTITPPPANTPVANDSSMAMAGLTFGLISYTCCFGFIFAVLGIVCSIIALTQPQNKNRGLAVAGLVLSILGLVSHIFLPAFLSLFFTDGEFGHHHWRHFLNQ